MEDVLPGDAVFQGPLLAGSGLWFEYVVAGFTVREWLTARGTFIAVNVSCSLPVRDIGCDAKMVASRMDSVVLIANRLPGVQ